MFYLKYSNLICLTAWISEFSIKQPRKDPGRFKQVITNKLLNINYLRVFLQALHKILPLLSDGYSKRETNRLIGTGRNTINVTQLFICNLF
jgi:hypothetical protein